MIGIVDGDGGQPAAFALLSREVTGFSVASIIDQSIPVA